MSINAAREGDFTANQTYLENLASVFFPLDGGDKIKYIMSSMRNYIFCPMS